MESLWAALAQKKKGKGSVDGSREAERGAASGGKV